MGIAELRAPTAVGRLVRDVLLGYGLPPADETCRDLSTNRRVLDTAIGSTAP
jgi:hypothetical protein